MSEIIPSAISFKQQNLCYYTNSSSQIQVGLISNIPGHRIEQVLFPGQRWMFWANPSAQLDIYSSDEANSQPIFSVACEALRVVETEPADFSAA